LKTLAQIAYEAHSPEWIKDAIWGKEDDEATHRWEAAAAAVRAAVLEEIMSKQVDGIAGEIRKRERALVLEEAAKVCDEKAKTFSIGWEADECAAAIRSLK
jgi:hypothetical protein